MFIAMNRFRIALGRESEFESIWRERATDMAEPLSAQPPRRSALVSC